MLIADGGGSGLGVPAGDPAGLRAAAAALRRTAAETAGAVRAVRSEGGTVVAAGGWQGPAASAFTGRVDRLGTAAAVLPGVLTSIAGALETYATALAAAQATARAAVSAAAVDPASTAGETPAAVAAADELHLANQESICGSAFGAAAAAAATAAAAVRAATGRLPDRGEAPPEAQAAASDEKDAGSFLEDIDRFNTRAGWLISPTAVGLAALEGKQLLTAVTSVGEMAADYADTMRSGAVLLYVSGVIDKGTLASIFAAAGDGAMPSLAQLPNFLAGAGNGAVGSLENGGVPEESALAGKLGLPAGAFDAAGRAFAVLGVASDVATLINPGDVGSVEGGLDRGAAGLNIVGTGLAFAPDGAAEAIAGTAGAMLGTDVAVGWVPVVGQVIVAGTALYLAGDWAYNNVTWFHDGVDDVGHYVASGVMSEVHGLETDYHVAAATVTTGVHLASDAASTVVHVGSDLASGAAHASSSVIHAGGSLLSHLNPF